MTRVPPALPAAERTPLSQESGPTPATVSSSPTETHSVDLAPVRVRVVTLLAVLLPFVGLVAAIMHLWGWGFNWLYVGLLLGMYMATAIGITVGYHRLFTHRSFETTGFMKFIFAMLGSMAVEGPVLKWAAMHRRHHQHSDGVDDPHSPHHHGEGLRGLLLGFWHAHVGWIFDGDPGNLSRYVGDLLRDRWIRAASSTWFIWAAMGMIVPAILGGIISGSWSGVVLGFVWGGLVRLFFVHHITWSINSICHLWGTRPFRSHDESRNNVIFGLIGLGEGWHNNHHAFPTSARHGLRWWQFDFSYYVIRAMALVGLAWKIRVPETDAIAAKMKHA
jgi:stearoyl-CoA desaturase (delta-9 desaturase)